MSKSNQNPQNERGLDEAKKNSQQRVAASTQHVQSPVCEDIARMKDEGGSQPQGTVPPSYRGD